MKRITLATALFAAALCGNAQSLYVTPMKGNVNLRTAPSTTAAKAGMMTRSDMLPLVEELEGWYKVDHNGQTVYVSQSVSTTCSAEIPEEMYGKDFTSNGPLDEIRFQGFLIIEPVDKGHVLITVNWMRLNTAAEMQYFLADVKDGKIIATHGGASCPDADSPIATIKEALDELEKPIPVGFDEFNNTIYFDGAEYSEYE